MNRIQQKCISISLISALLLCSCLPEDYNIATSAPDLVTEVTTAAIESAETTETVTTAITSYAAWKCKDCGNEPNYGKFCSECGEPRSHSVTDETAADTTAAAETTTDTSVASENNAIYADEELCYLAGRYYGARTNYIPEFIEIESEEDEIVTIHLYDVLDGHTATADWYYVDRRTAAGTDIAGHEIDLNQPLECWNPEVSLREKLGADDFCGVLYLGSFDSGITGDNIYSAVYKNLLEQSGFAGECEWFSEMKDGNFVKMDGEQVYLIIPRDDEAHVIIHHVEPVENKDYGRIYSSYNGAPFLLVCNVSEIASNVSIQITDNSGEHPVFAPYLSGKDGSPQTDCENVKIFNN